MYFLKFFRGVLREKLRREVTQITKDLRNKETRYKTIFYLSGVKIFGTGNVFCKSSHPIFIVISNL